MKKRPKLKSNKDLELYSNGGKFMAAVPGILTAGVGIASEFMAPGNPMGIKMIASGAGSAISGVNQYNQQQDQSALQNQAPQHYQTPYEMPKSYAANGGVMGNLPKRYDDGGVHKPINQGIPNARLENKEMYNIPNGPIGQVNKGSHKSRNDALVNIPDGTGMLPDNNDRLKVNKKLVAMFSELFNAKDIGKTFSDTSRNLKTTKEDKILKDNKASGEARSRAEFNISFKKDLYDRKMQALEQFKQSEYQASIDKASKKYGVNPEQFANGGQFGVPKFDGGGYSTPKGTFDKNGVKIAGPYGEDLADDIDRGDNQNDFYMPKNSAQPSPPSNPMFNTNMFPSRKPVQTTPGYDPNRFVNKPIIGQPFDITSGAKQLPVANANTAYVPLAETQGYKPGAMDYIGAGAQLGADAIRMAKSLKKPQTYQPSLYRPERYDPSQSLREADQTNRLMREQARVNSGGNAASYIAGMAGLQAGQVGNKNAIRSQYDQMNVNTGNQAGQINSQLLTQRAKDVQQDWSVRDNAIADSANKMASTVANPAKDYNEGVMDEKKLRMIGGKYYRYNKKTDKFEEHNPTTA